MKFIQVLALIVLSGGKLFSQQLNITQAGLIEGGSGITPNLTLATGVFISGNYAYVVGAGDALEILDITLPGLVQHKGSLANGAGGANILRPQHVFVSGNYAYITSNGGNALEIVDVSDPSAPVHKGSLSDGGGNAPYLNQPWDVYVSGNYAYVTANNSNAIEVIDVSNPAQPVHAGSLMDGGGVAPYLQTPLSIQLVGHYAYVGTSGALEIIDISNPTQPVHAGGLTDGGGSAPFLNMVYSLVVSGNYAYMTDDAGRAFEIVDVSNPASPVHTGSIVDGGGAAPYLYSPFSVAVANGKAYVSNIGSFEEVGNATAAIEVIDVSNPEAPQHLSALLNPSLMQSRSLVLSGSNAYITSRVKNCLNVVDISNASQLTLTSTVNSGTGGALLNGASSVYVSGDYAYATSIYSSALEILDVSTKSQPIHKGSITNGEGGSLLSSPLGVFVAGSYAYVASNGSNALEIVDVSNPALPSHKGSLTLFYSGLYYIPNAVFVSGSYAYVACGAASGSQNALFIINVANPSTPVIVGMLADGTGGAHLQYPRSVFVSGNNAFVASAGSNALEIIDISNPASPLHKGSLQNGVGGALLSSPSSVFVSSNYAYVASSGSNAIEIVNVSNPATPVHTGSLSDGGGVAPYLLAPSSISVSGNYAYVASNGSKAVEVIDVSNAASPVHKGSLLHGTSGALLDGPNSVFISNGYGYVANSNLYQDVDIFFLYGPGITNISPMTGQVGTTVTVAGQNFNTFITASIDGIGAPISSVSANSLQITVPSGTTIGKISLSYNGQLVTSNSNFVTTPSALASTALGSSQGTVSWTDVGAKGYFIDLSTDNFATFVSGYNNASVGSTTSLVLMGLQPAQVYQYRVRSYDGISISSNSNVITFQTTPTMPVARAATAITQISFTANWHSVKGATGYYLDVSTDNSFSQGLLAGYTHLNVPGLADTAQYVTGLTPYTQYYYRVSAYDGSGTSAYSSVVGAFTPDTLAPEVSLSSANPTVLTFGDAQPFGVTVTDNVRVDTVKIFYKGISRTSFNQQTLTSTAGSYSVTAQTSWLDSLGLEYYFSARDEAGNIIISSKQYVPVTYTSIALPPLPSGDAQSSYRIISFPYRMSSENLAALAAVAPLDDDTKVAIWWWDPSSKNYSKFGANSSLSTFNPGQGYWMLVRNTVTPLLSNVTAPNYNRANLYTMTLKPGWNEIGNPYPVDVSWDDVLAFNQQVNPGATFSSLSVYDGTGYKQATGSRTLKAFEGGFVKNLGTSDVTIQIPFPGQANIGSRTSSTATNEDGWNLSLTISQQGRSNELGGFGMHSQALQGPDRFDNFNPPAFVDIPEVNFTESDFRSILFSKDVVPLQEYYHWQFTVAGKNGESTTLTWDSDVAKSLSFPLLLFDEDNLQIVDMTETDHYQFSMKAAAVIHVYYGANAFNFIATSKIAASDPYPNPVVKDDEVAINIGLPDQSTDYMATVAFYTMQGKTLGSFQKLLPPGINTLKFDMEDYCSGSGMVIYTVSVTSGNDHAVFSGKIIKQ